MFNDNKVIEKIIQIQQSIVKLYCNDTNQSSFKTISDGSFKGLILSENIGLLSYPENGELMIKFPELMGMPDQIYVHVYVRAGKVYSTFEEFTGENKELESLSEFIKSNLETSGIMIEN